MSYFNKFPLLNYSFDNGVTTKVAVDILKRIGFKDSIKNATELFTDYEVLDGETPDNIMNAEINFPEQIGMNRFIGTQRSNGFAAMIKQMKLYALALGSKSQTGA